jgi:DNA repair protein RadC
LKPLNAEDIGECHMKLGRPKKRKQVKSQGVKTGLKLLKKKNPQSLEALSDTELLSLLIPIEAAKTLLEEYENFENLIKVRSLHEINFLPNVSYGTIARVQALIEFVRRTQKNKVTD